ncbi:MAG: hypothetical protein H6Q88_2004 [Anaeromyxobacteraceae bacterium]|nr:hypothetical protein [Anaeromyxobacteraceae bacterium]
MTGPGRSLHNIHYRTHPGALNGGFWAFLAAFHFLGTAVACTPAAPPQAAAASTGPSGLAAPTGPVSPVPEPLVPPAPSVLPATAVETRVGDTVVTLAPDVPALVDPAATFEVRLPTAVRGARLVLLDARDAVVPSNESAEVGGSTSRFTLVPMEPLTPASRYVLRVEGLESRLIRSDDGRTFEPLSVPFRVSGDPPPTPPKKAKKKRAR